MKLKIRMYDFLRWKLFCSFIFIFYQVRFSTDTERVIIGMCLRPLVSVYAVEQEGSKFVVRFPVLKCECAKNGISRDFYLQYACHEFIVVSEANNTIINIQR